MAGTDHRRDLETTGPAVILARPQLGENIGMTCRAMLNCGLTDLRLVAPREGWSREKATAAASGADRVLEGAGVFATLAEATADLRLVYATSTRPRGLVKLILEPGEAVKRIAASLAGGAPAGLLFGPEKAGLTNDDLALADGVVSVPLNPAFASLNLAQAVLLLGYEWRRLTKVMPAAQLELNAAPRAPKAELENFCNRLESALVASGFLYPPEKRPTMVQNLRSLFGRMDLTEPEVKTLHGIVTSLRDFDPTQDG